MKHIILIIGITLTLALLAFAHSRTVQTESNSQHFDDGTTQGLTDQARAQVERAKTVATQKRINSYFQRDVISKVRECWKGLKGKGVIEMKFTYAKVGRGWTLEKVERSESTLPQGQDSVALQCMQNAARATSFPVEEDARAANTRASNMKAGEGAAKEFVVHWSWPVPLPANAAEARMAGGLGNRGGCDGNGASARCMACVFGPLRCNKVCVGYSECTLYSDGSCGAGGANCASGGPFGFAGGGGFIARLAAEEGRKTLLWRN